MTKLPEAFISEMNNLLGDEASLYFESLKKDSFRGLRVNTNKISVKDFLKISPFELKSVPWCSTGFYIINEGPIAASKHPYYFAGLYYLQEPSAMSPAEFLPVCKNDIVLDMCAAPGGKATHLSAKAGFLFANDISVSRAQALLKNLELSGADNICVTAENPHNLVKDYKGFFDKILVDAPCSGEGMFRKEPHLIDSYIERGPEYYHDIQLDVLECGYELLKDGGLILYSTCTFSPFEDEKVVLDFLENHSDMKVIHIPNRYDGFEKGILSVDEAARLYPHKIDGEGHFLCLMAKGEYDTSEIDFLQKNTTDSVCNSVQTSNKTDIIELKVNDKIYLVPDWFKVKKSIRYLRTGLLVGEEKNNKTKYSQAYAMSISEVENYNRLKLKADDDRVYRYLKGETVFAEDIDLINKSSDVLVCVDGYPLGWAVNSNGRLKNKLAKGWILN